ncbi:aminoglycoside 3'-phosphotransferase [Cohnella pontilimi]|uniref:Aminoglycoside 3'-phosphotransferase n=1 Tax=Cohnella pontilimi TaxID=2564100 RepID=A0A4U0FC53_9BACL|nr:APH(3') family aminoglycoside O-phosphotransferase [Cohnella pontilimi]TJY41794.1 aminoglycoside 3'-phosphotransferase [Cohnella pontilimi]
MQKPQVSEGLSRLTEGLEWKRITIGYSEANTFLLTGAAGNRYLKVLPVGSVETLRQEKERMEWLQGKLPVPEILYYEDDGSNEYLLMSEIPGLDASHRLYESMLPQLMRELAAGLRAIHEVDIRNCPFDQRLERKIGEAGKRVENRLVDEDDFDEIREGCTAEQLFQELIREKPADEDLVFTHGDYCLPNVILQDGRLSGFIDWGRAGVADRYQDIALAVRSIRYNFGEEYVATFLDVYGITQLDESKVSYYQLMDEFF